ncbi:MAG: SRPBCC domain-containing protein [Pseudomonadota bacterium]
MRLLAIALALAAPAAHAQQIVTEADGSRTLTVETLVPAPPAEVWQAVSTAEGWKSWAVPAAWLSGDVLETAYDPQGKPGDPNNIQQRFVERVPGRSLVFRTIRTPAGFPHAEAFMGVTHFLLLLPEAGGTRVRLTDKGYPAGAAGDALLGFFKAGNQQTIDHLAARFGLAPFDFLAGHCWRGTLPTGDVDTHCFKPGGGQLVDHHEVARAGTKVYWGDTVYAWSGGAIGFTYTDMGGGVMKGSARQAPDGLDFGASDYVGTSGAKITIATRWVRIGSDAFEARNISTVAAHNRTTRYTRID